MPDTPQVPRTVLLAVMCVGMFLVQLDVTIVNVSLLPIQHALGGDNAATQWVVGGYIVALSAALIPSGNLADRAGTRASTLFGLGAFACASAAAGLAPSIGFLVAARIGQGLAAAILLPRTLAVVNQLFTEPAEKARAMGLWAGVSALALPAGPILGGLLCNTGFWRGIFLLNVPVCVIALFMCLRLLSARTPAEALPRLNWRNLALIAVCLFTLVLTATLLRDGSPLLIATFASISAATASLVVHREIRLEAPVIPAVLRNNNDFRRATGISLAMNFVGIGLIFSMSQYFEGTQDLSPLQTGLRMLPLFLPLALGAPLTGKLVARIGPRRPMGAGLITGAFGCAALGVFIPLHNSLWIYTGLFAVGAGMGLLTPAVVAYAMQCSPVELSGLSSSINNAARQAGGALGVAAFGTLTGPAAGNAGPFLDGIRLCGFLSAALWLLCLGSSKRAHALQ